MSRLRKEKLLPAALQFSAVLLLSLGLSLPALRALLPRQALWPAALICLGCALALEGLYLLPMKRKWLLPAGLLALLTVWGALGGGPMHTAVQLVKAAFLTLRGIPDAVTPYADAARWAVCILFSLLAAALVWDNTLPMAFFAVGTLLTLLFVFFPQAELLLLALPAAAGLVLMMAQGGWRRVSALVLAAMLAVGAFLLTPAQPQTVPQLEKIATDIRQFVEDYLFFNEYRASFSLASEGYQPLEKRLGGPAEPVDHLALEVETDRTLLLRGKTYDEYTGLTWYDTLSDLRYLYASNRYAARRTAVFDLDRPLTGGTVEPETLRVRVLGPGTTTLFAPGFTRTLQTESERMVLYYNSAGELFITRNLEEGDRYTLTYLPYIAGSRATAEAVAACAGEEDSRYEEICDAYLKLPRHIQQEIIDMAMRAAGDAVSPYEKALNIMRWLRSNYRYTLDVAQPPDGIDFVAWFLIGEKEGYCTYFASAMTVLCRIAGIPARYVTGYVAAPDETGRAIVTGREAHAWTEVYLKGFGWLALDATPRSGSAMDGDDEADADRQPPERPTPTPAPTPQLEKPTPTPEPENGSDQDAAPEETPTPQPDEAALDTPTPPPALPAGTEEDTGGFSLPLIAALLLLLLFALLVLRYFLTEPLRRAARRPRDGAVILFSAIIGLLARQGLSKPPHETIHEFALRADEQLASRALPSLYPLAEALGSQLYGQHFADAAPFRAAYIAYRSAAKPWVRAAAALHRMLTFGKRGRKTAMK